MPYRGRFAYLANDPDEFCSAVASCLEATDLLATPEECFAFAKENDWDARVQVLEREALIVYPKISVIVLCYNQLDYTRKCVESILRVTAYPNYELVLVDNASTDSTAIYIAEVAATHQNVKIVLNKTNRGFAGGNNDGIAVSEGDYLVLLNNDTIVTRGWLWDC
jgi:cellulose synthase/poly-beta-1,6-N-acetylglucosamine synthase-like glycosyltransferase